MAALPRLPPILQQTQFIYMSQFLENAIWQYLTSIGYLAYEEGRAHEEGRFSKGDKVVKITTSGELALFYRNKYICNTSILSVLDNTNVLVSYFIIN